MAMAPFRNPHAYTETNSPTSNCGDASKGKADPTAPSCTITNPSPCNNSNPQSKESTIPNSPSSQGNSLQRHMNTNTPPKLKRGAWNNDNTKRFWAMHPSGREMWVTPERMEATKESIKLGQFKIKP